jgi:guanosine-3',5'-bis(diphosphate) 3'-pyrophosphohydrolase
MRWLRRTIELLAEGSNPEEFLEHTKLELFHDQVFCFTPKGKLIALPRGATPIDFAYAVHTDVGNMAIGAKINGKIGSAQLAAAERRRGADPDLEGADRAAGRLGIDRGDRQGARAIRRATRDAVRRPIFRARPAHRRAALPARQDRLFGRTAEGALAAAGARLDRRCDVGGRPRRDEGRRRRARHVSRLQGRARHAGRRRRRRAAGSASNAAKAVKFKVPDGGENGAAIPIRGINTDLPVRFAPNGGAVPGDRIVGIMTPGEGITIYPIQSEALKQFEDEPERWLDVRWDVDDKTPQRFPAQLAVQSVNEPGTLAQIAQVIAEHDGNIDNIRMSRQSPDFTELTIDLEVYNLKHLTSIISQLRAKKVVAGAERVNG